MNRGMVEDDISLKFRCPMCGAKPLERCDMNSGKPRVESHRERQQIEVEDHWYIERIAHLVGSDGSKGSAAA